MKTFFLIHGTFGNPCENWFPWLVKEIQKNYDMVFVPHFPTPEGQNYKNWESILLQYSEFIDNNTVFVAHSSGCPFIIDFVIKNEISIKGLICISGFYDFFIGDETFDNLNKGLYLKDINISDVKKFSGFVYCIYSDNDPFLPQNDLSNFADKVSSDRKIIKQGGHFNEDAGYVKFPELLKILKKYE